MHLLPDQLLLMHYTKVLYSTTYSMGVPMWRLLKLLRDRCILKLKTANTKLIALFIRYTEILLV